MPFGQGRSVGEHELNMRAGRSWHLARIESQRVERSRHGNEFDLANLDFLEPLDGHEQWPHDAQRGASVEDQLSYATQRLDIETQRHRRECRLERLQCIDQTRRREHDVDRERDLRLEPLEKTFYLGPQNVDTVGHGTRLDQHGAPRLREPGLARSDAIEERQPELRLEVIDRVADGRRCAIEAPGGACKAARFDYGQKDLELIERGKAGIGHNEIPEKFVQDYTDFQNGTVPLFSPSMQTWKEIRMMDAASKSSGERAQTRAVASVHRAIRTIEGDGFEVRRAIPSKHFEAIGPFILLDHYGPIDVAPGDAKGASAHPHAGIETLTLLLEGRSQHKDSLGNASSMRPGEVQWMRAGRGIVHDEGPDDEMRRAGGRTHGVQLWLNMPKGHKHEAPAYRHVSAHEIPVLTPDEHVRARVIAGRVGELAGPIVTTGSPFIVHASLKAGRQFDLPTTGAAQLAAYVMVGAARVGDSSGPIEAGQLARLTPGDHLIIEASGDDTELLLVGGDPLDAPIVRHGPFVMNSIGELERAVRDYYAGRMGRVGA